MKYVVGIMGAVAFAMPARIDVLPCDVFFQSIWLNMPSIRSPTGARGALMPRPAVRLYPIFIPSAASPTGTVAPAAMLKDVWAESAGTARIDAAKTRATRDIKRIVFLR